MTSIRWEGSQRNQRYNEAMYVFSLFSLAFPFPLSSVPPFPIQSDNFFSTYQNTVLSCSLLALIYLSGFILGGIFWGKWLLQLSTPPGPGTPFMWSCCTLYIFLDFIIIVTCMSLPLECEPHVGDNLSFSITTLSLIPGYVLDILVKLNKYLLNEIMNESFQV